jgi:hypothetical protein
VRGGVESVALSDKQRSREQEPGIEKDVRERIVFLFFIPERSAEAWAARIARRGMIAGLPNDRRADGSGVRPPTATVDRLTEFSGVNERNRPENHERDDFHVRKGPSLFTKKLAIVPHSSHYIVSVKRV